MGLPQKKVRGGERPVGCTTRKETAATIEEVVREKDSAHVAWSEKKNTVREVKVPIEANFLSIKEGNHRDWHDGRKAARELT